VNPAVVQESPLEKRARRRILLFLGGYLLVIIGLLIAWQGAAGVTVSPANFYSGPTPASLGLLVGVIGLLVAGAFIVARYGSIYGSEEAAGSVGTLDGGWNLGRAALLLGILGGALLLLGLSLPVSNLGFGAGLLPLAISPSVLFVPETIDSIALGILASGICLLAIGRRRRPSEFRAWWRRTGRYVSIVGVTVILVVAGLVLVPVRQSFSAQLQIPGGSGGGVTDYVFPSGSPISGSWTASPAGSVNFTIQGPYGFTVYSSNSSFGTFSFPGTRATWELYLFVGRATSNETVIVSGTYYASTWPWPPGEPGEPTSVLP
jgi:hypothetical protein